MHHHKMPTIKKVEELLAPGMCSSCYADISVGDYLLDGDIYYCTDCGFNLELGLQLVGLLKNLIQKEVPPIE